MTVFPSGSKACAWPVIWTRPDSDVLNPCAANRKNTVSPDTSFCPEGIAAPSSNCETTESETLRTVGEGCLTVCAFNPKDAATQDKARQNGANRGNAKQIL